jgi:hypothetical protein
MAFGLAEFHKASLYSHERYLESQEKYCLPCVRLHVHRTHTKAIFVGIMHPRSSKSYKDCENYINLYLSLLFCTMTNKCTIISQITTLLHVSTLSCHPQTACNQYVAKLQKYFKCSCW